MRRLLTLLASLAVTVGPTVVVAAPVQAAPAPGNIKNNAASFGVSVRPAPSAGTVRVTGKGLSALALDDATMRDLSTYAKASGQDLSALVAAHQGIHEFSAYTTKLEETRPDMFVRAGVPVAGGATAHWIQTTSKPSADVVAELELLPVNTEVRYGAPASSKELADLAYALTTSLAARSDVIRSAGAGYDHERRVMRLQYASVGTARLSALDPVIHGALTAGTVGGQLPVDVVIERDDADVVVTEAVVKGGRSLTANGEHRCTSGFTARRAGNTGVLTAEHCTNALRYLNTSGVISTNPRRPANDAIDFQFHRTLTGNGHSTSKQFRAGSEDRTVTGVANAPLDSTVCHWGQSTGYSCSRVSMIDNCHMVSGHRYCGLDFTYDDISAGGDSGGPWFLGNTARGGHTGARDGQFSVFTRIGRVNRHLDARVLQN
ncbi:S1 family peptidase [Kibdelosporangium persicum]|uniref:Streptogrisin C n=1 Tax=Kibdelosporangium persicum TaxID=2698649 RepID=A0ABX2F8S2_9PSEU|nr:S1 family peptidase [Kibdelosporangium persicum]NRN67370.1 hypothetical protein [Kibdelosporangium persicum]